jgi:hypothetical protein
MMLQLVVTARLEQASDVGSLDPDGAPWSVLLHCSTNDGHSATSIRDPLANRTKASRTTANRDSTLGIGPALGAAMMEHGP